MLEAAGACETGGGGRTWTPIVGATEREGWEAEEGTGAWILGVGDEKSASWRPITEARLCSKT